MSRIKEEREKAGITRKELCESIKLPYRTLQGWEKEERTPPVWAEYLIIEKIKNIALHKK